MTWAFLRDGDNGHWLYEHCSLNDAIMQRNMGTKKIPQFLKGSKNNETKSLRVKDIWNEVK